MSFTNPLLVVVLGLVVLDFLLAGLQALDLPPQPLQLGLLLGYGY